MERRVTNRTAEKELGFGNTITAQERLMNRDGSFNIDRRTKNWTINLYHHLVSVPWWVFLLYTLSVYTIANAIFATLFVLVGVEHLSGVESGTPLHNFMEAYFFSSQTLTTVGYGRISPEGLPANLIASVESLTGLLSFALISGLMYGRFSRAVGKLIFSPVMLVSPYKEGRALMFRVANARKSELIESEASMILAINQADEKGNTYRRFYDLHIEIRKISFMALTWTLVHPLDDKSPIAGFNQEDLKAAKAEWLIIIKGVDDTYAQTIYDRYSYTTDDIVWNARFSPIISFEKGKKPAFLAEDVGKYNLL